MNPKNEKNCQKWSKNPKIQKNPEKSQKFTFFVDFFAEKKSILLVFQYQEDAIRPELSSPAHFRIPGGYAECDIRTNERTKEILGSNLGYS